MPTLSMRLRDGLLWRTSGAEAGELSFRLLRGPDGMQLAADTGLVVWAPSAGQAGAHPVALLKAKAVDQQPAPVGQTLAQLPQPAQI